MDRCRWSNSENEEVRRKDRHQVRRKDRHQVRRKDHRRLRREPSLSQDDGSSQGLLLTELHQRRFELHRQQLRSTVTVGDQQRRWFGFGSLIAVWFFFFFFINAFSEMF